MTAPIGVTRSGGYSDLAATAAGGNGAAYPPSGNDITEGGIFAGGQFAVGPGQTETGWVTYELPPGVTVTRRQGRPAFGSGAITWAVNGKAARPLSGSGPGSDDEQRH